VYVGNVDKVEEGVQLLRDDKFLTLNAGRNPTTPATLLLRQLHNASEAVRNRLQSVYDPEDQFDVLL
jgi:hypothetical protein